MQAAGLHQNPHFIFSTGLLKCKMSHFFSLSFSEAAHSYSCHTKNFAVVTKFSDSLAEKLSMCKIVRQYNSRYPTIATILVFGY